MRSPVEKINGLLDREVRDTALRYRREAARGKIGTRRPQDDATQCVRRNTLFPSDLRNTPEWRAIP